MDEIRILGTLNIGYGFSRQNFEAAFAWKPDYVVAQGTSADPGPWFLGSGYLDPGVVSLRRDFQNILLPSLRRKVPVITSAGHPSGADAQLEPTLEIVNDIARDHELRFRAAVISGELTKEYVLEKIRQGVKIRRLVDHPRLVEYLGPEEVSRAERIVAQMGPEPIMAALDRGVEVVITGRALDTGLYMAPLVRHGADRGLAAHMGKVMECGAVATDLGGFDSLFGIMRKDHFVVKPADPNRRCTVLSVSGHAFYERADPSRELNPGGALDVSGAVYEQVDERSVKVSGSQWHPAGYTVKLEGAARVGWRAIAIAGIRDPGAVGQIDAILEAVRARVEEHFGPDYEHRLLFRVYGKDGVMGESEPQKEITSHELCVIVDVVAPTQDLAMDICSFSRANMTMAHFPGRITTAGNIASPFAPREIPCGAVYVYNIWHLLSLDDPLEPFPVRIVDFPYR